VVMRRGDIYWVDLGDPVGSEPGYLRPAIVIQEDEFNNSNLATTIILSMTSNIDYRKFPGCVLLKADETGLPKDSIANASQIRTVNRARLVECVGQLDDSVMYMVDNALKRVLGL